MGSAVSRFGPIKEGWATSPGPDYLFTKICRGVMILFTAYSAVLRERNR